MYVCNVFDDDDDDDDEEEAEEEEEEEDSGHKFFCISFQYYMYKFSHNILKESNVHIIMNASSSEG
jgi:hypothetical protein